MAQKAKVVTCRAAKKNPTCAKANPAKRKPTKKQLAALAKGRKMRAQKAKKSTTTKAKSNPSKAPKLSFKSRAKRGAKKAARKAGTAAAEGTKKAAVWTGKKLAKGGKRAGRKAWGTTKEAAKGTWKGIKKGWKENPTEAPKSVINRIKRLESKACEMYQLAEQYPPPESDHYFEEGEKLLHEAQNEAYEYGVDIADLGTGHLPTPWEVANNPISAAKRKRMSLSLFALPKQRKYRLDSPARNKYSLTLLDKHYDDGVRSKKDYETAYINIMVAFIKNGQIAKRAPKVKTAATQAAFKAASPIKNPASPVSVKAKKQAFKKLLSTCRAYVKQGRMTDANCRAIEARSKKVAKPLHTTKANPTKDQLHVTSKQKTRGGKKVTDYFVMHGQDWIRVKPSYAKAILKSGKAVKVPWSHAKLPHHAPSAKLDNRELGLMMHRWHASMSDPIYAAGSTLFAGQKTSNAMLARALDGIRSLKSKMKSAADKKELRLIEKNLEHRVGIRRSRGAAMGAKPNPTGRLADFEASFVEMRKALGEPEVGYDPDTFNEWTVQRGNSTFVIYDRKENAAEHPRRKFLWGIRGSGDPKRFLKWLEQQVPGGRAVGTNPTRKKAGGKLPAGCKVKLTSCTEPGMVPEHAMGSVAPTQHVAVKSLKEASEVVRQYIDMYGLFGSNWGSIFGAGDIKCGNKVVARVAYNGTVWKPGPWKSGMKPLYDPRKANPTGLKKTRNEAGGNIPAVSITLTRKEGGNHDLNEPHTIEGGDVWNKANVLLSLWGREAQPGKHNKVDFHIRYADGETYSGKYYVSRGDQVTGHLGKHITDTMKAASGKKRPSHLTQAQYKQKITKLSPAQKRKYSEFLRKYEVGCLRCK